MRRGLAAGLVMCLVLVAAACNQETPSTDSGPRFPDDQGIVSDIDFESLSLEGGESYTISPEVQSFSTYTGELASLLTWEGRYVHLGLDGDEVVWVAGIGVVDKTGDSPVVHYTNGLLEEIDDQRRAIFADGTVLKLADEVEDPPVGRRMTADIDPRSHEVILLRVSLTPPSPAPDPTTSPAG